MRKQAITAITGVLLLGSRLLVADPEPGGPSARVMPVMFDLVCAGATTACMLLNPVIGGQLLLPDGTVAAPSLSFSGAPTTGFSRLAATQLILWSNAGVNSGILEGGVRLGSAGAVAFSSAAAPQDAAADLRLGRGGATGSLRVYSGTAPTCTGNCGTSPSVVGNNTNMSVTIGTAPPAAANFTVTFNGTWTTAPHCLGQRGTTGTTPVVAGIVTTTTTAVVNLSANLVASELFRVFCFGP